VKIQTDFRAQRIYRRRQKHGSRVVLFLERSRVVPPHAVVNGELSAGLPRIRSVVAVVILHLAGDPDLLGLSAGGKTQQIGRVRIAGSGRRKGVLRRESAVKSELSGRVVGLAEIPLDVA